MTVRENLSHKRAFMLLGKALHAPPRTIDELDELRSGLSFVGSDDKSPYSVADEGFAYHGFFVKVTILGKKETVGMIREGAQYLLIGNTALHEVRLGFNRDTTFGQAFYYAVARKVFIENEDQAAARWSISQRRASSTAAISRS